MDRPDHQHTGHPTLGRGGTVGGQTSARIVAYRIMTCTDPEREVLNTCDTKLCLNPRHLVLAGEKSKATMRERIEENVQKAGPDEYWLWKQKRGAAGYGRLSMGKGKNPLLAHRVAWELACGPVPGGARPPEVRQPTLLQPCPPLSVPELPRRPGNLRQGGGGMATASSLTK